MGASVRVVDRGFDDMMNRARALAGGFSVKIGVLSDPAAGGLHQTDETGKAKPLTVAEIAAVMEYGTQDGKIPKRPFIRPVFDNFREEIQKDIAKIAVDILFGDRSPEQAFGALGLKYATKIREYVLGGTEVQPTNADSTKARKEAKSTRKTKFGGVRTLVDTGRMIGAVSWAVLRGEKQGPVKAPWRR